MRCLKTILVSALTLLSIFILLPRHSYAQARDPAECRSFGVQWEAERNRDSLEQARQFLARIPLTCVELRDLLHRAIKEREGEAGNDSGTKGVEITSNARNEEPERRPGGSALDHRTTNWPGYAMSQRVRKRVEEIFGWIKTVGNFRRTRYRGVERTSFAAYLVGAAYNLLRIAKLCPSG